MSDDTKPTVDIPFDEALQELTGFEILGVQKHYGERFEKLGGVQSLIGTVWAYENRTARVDWSVVEKMSLRQLNAYFASKDPVQEESEQGEE